MRIEKIKLTNFRQYRAQEIAFPLEDCNEQFVVIKGANGTGKTNILNAIYWCFYGEEMDITDKNKGKPLVNDVALNLVGDGENVVVSVEILMRDDENRKVIFLRLKKFNRGINISCKPILDASVNSHDGTTLSIYQEKEEFNLKPLIGNLDELIEQNFPKEISRYFLFNGETLDKYFRQPADIKKEVFNLSQLQTLECCISHVSYVEKEINRGLRDSSPKVSEYYELKEQAEGRVKELSGKMQNISVEIEVAEKLISDLSEKLRNSSSEQIKRLQDERESLEAHLKRHKQELKNEENDFFKYLVTIMPQILCYETVVKTLKIIREKRDAGDFPPPVTPDFLKEILASGRCICGCDIENKKDARKRITDLVSQYDITRSLVTEVGKLEPKLNDITQEVVKFKEKQIKFCEETTDIKGQIENGHNRLAQIDNQIGSCDVALVARWDGELKDVKKIKREKEEEIARFRVDMISQQKNAQNYSDLHKRELSKLHANEKLKQKALFCTESRTTLESLKNEIMEEIRASIEEKTEKQFFELTWKKNSYSKVSIDDNYSISVKDLMERECVGTLSAGERQVLALSFMAALNTVSGFQFPIVIDTPLGRISEVPKANIARNLHDFLKGRQVLLLVTEVEYSNEVRDLLKKSVAKEYHLKFDETKSGSEVEVIADA